MSVIDLLSADSPLGEQVDSFSPRPHQVELAEKIEQTISSGGVLVAEAGTGVGKTYAYLIPAMMSDKKVIIATGTKNLQDQLFQNDVPAIRKSMISPVSVALLKGRANYLCIHRLEIQVSDGRHVRSWLHELELIREWAGRTLSGDIAEVDDIEETSMVWPLVTSTTENCVGQECEHYDECYVLKARRQAQTADLVVINHHLLFADMSLKEQGFGDILPGADLFIIDEAHQLPDVAADFFGTTITSRQLYNLSSDIRSEFLKDGGSIAELPQAIDKLEQSISDVRISLGDSGQRLAWNDVVAITKFRECADVVVKNLQFLQEWLCEQSDRGRGLENCHKRCSELLSVFASMIRDTSEEEDLAEEIQWCDTTRRGFGLHTTPLNIDEIFRQQMTELQAIWVFTSATLTVDGKFNHFTGRLGLEDPDTLQLGSPFDYQNNGLKYLPMGMPEPSNPDYTRAVCDQAIPVINAAGGRSFILFTSHRALQWAARYLEDRIGYPLLVQGQAPKQRLVHDFKQKGNAVLLGTASFWEGVDVRGSALSCVIIDKLPFASPGDPIVQARIDLLKKQGKNPFFDYQIPLAVVSMKQGAGRLIRDITDCGILMLCDPRLLGKPYGKVFLRSLPDMPISRKLEDVMRFFELRKTA